MIPDQQVDEVRARADIVDVIGEFVPLKKAGKEFKARCPFHEERTPSFYVVPEKGFFKCFGCGESGDVFAFLMRQSGLDFVEAIKHVAARSGVEIREVAGRAQEDPNRPLYELNAFAREFYVKTLADADDGRLARDYLASRGVGPETAERFGLGYAPDDWRALREAAGHHGYADEQLVSVGLASTSESSPEPYDRFRNRIVFPIEDVAGRTVAFGGRVLGRDKGGPKYLNSPETGIYHKGGILYGLSWAKHAIRRERAALLVEGYMDVVMLAAGGVTNVVAPLGTSVTEDQARLLSRYATRALLLFDSDRAGLEATFRAGDVLLSAGLHPAVVTLPPGEDPDTVVRKEGPAGIRHYLEQAVDVLDRKLGILEERDFFGSIDRTRRAIDKLLPTLRAVADPALRDIYLAEVAERTGVRRETLEVEMTRRFSTASGGARVVPRREMQRAQGSIPWMGAERTVLLLMTRSHEFVERAAELLVPDDFADPTFRAIFEALLEDPGLRGPSPSMDRVVTKRLEELLAHPEEFAHAGRILEECVGRLKMEALNRQGEELERRLKSVGDEGERRRLIERKLRLAEQRRGMGEDWSHTARKLRT